MNGVLEDNMFKWIKEASFGHPREVYHSALWIFIVDFFSVFMFIAAFQIIYHISMILTGQAIYNPNLFLRYGILILGLLVLRLILEIVSYYQTYIKVYEKMSDKRLLYVEKLKKLPLGFIANKEKGEFVNSFGNDFSNLEQMLTFFLPQPISTTIFLIIVTISIMLYQYQIALAMIGLIPISWLLAWFAIHVNAKSDQKRIKTKEKVATKVNDYLNGIRELKNYNMANSEYKEVQRAFQEDKKTNILFEVKNGTFMNVAVNITRFITPLTAYVCTLLALNGTLNLFELIAFLAFSLSISSPILQTNFSFLMAKQFIPSIRRIHSVISQPDQQGEQTLLENDDIHMDHVTFGYDETKPILKDISMHFPKNQMTALVGHSGSGKTTITRLITRFYDINHGKITIGNQTIKEIKPEEIFQYISMVKQGGYLFRDTIRYNITFGVDVSEEQLKKICQQAHCWDFIQMLPEGLDTMIGEGGSTLSGGEKQRIIIARAMLKDAPILILDEPTASLDADNEAEVQKAIDALVKNRLVIIIAHRLKTIKHADNIYVLEKGEIAEQGTHEFLLQQNGPYAKMWNYQSIAQNQVY